MSESSSRDLRSPSGKTRDFSDKSNTLEKNRQMVMKPSWHLAILVVCILNVKVLASTVDMPSSGVLEAERLRCEYLTEPWGVDRSRPELSWIVVSKERNQSQSAFQILVATSAARLDRDQGDLWDSGKQDGDRTYGVKYSGSALRSHQRCYWKVRSWDRQGRPGPWSCVAAWTVGLLNSGEWAGDWIGWDAPRVVNSRPPAAPLDGAKWIGHADDSQGAASAVTRHFVTTWRLPEDVRLQRGELTVCADRRADVYVNGVQIAHVRQVDHPRTDDIVAHLHGGDNAIKATVWGDSSRSASLCLKAVAVDGEREYVLSTDDHWEIEESTAADSRDDSRAAGKVVVKGDYGSDPWGKPIARRDVTAPPAYLHGTFHVSKDVDHAIVYLASLGWADLSINGKLVNRDYFSSGWTDYNRRTYYRAYDATDFVKQGDNVWSAILADGWYSGHIGWAMDRDLYGKRPRMRAMLHVVYRDGSTDDFATNDSWKATTGPRQLADILIGEEYDARLESPSETATAHPPTLQSVDVGAEGDRAIQWHPGPPVVEVGEFPATSVKRLAPGVFIYDIGQNIAGVARLEVHGRPGQRIQLRYGERLNQDGTLYTANLRLARATDRYTCRGDGVEVWQPRQTFHGFQYIELSGVDEPLPLESITGLALSSDAPLASDFLCSDDKINRLYQNVLWTQRANFIDVPTDCPQRDERLGWTGDAQVYVRTATLMCDVQAFFRKWLVDLADAQRADGQFPKVAPVVLGQDDGGPAWADAGVICPWEVYWAYEDATLLAQQYPSMVKFVEYCRQRSKDGVLPPEDFHCFGDWLSVNADTPREVIYAAYYARCVDLLSRSAAVLGKIEDADKYAKLFERIKAAFLKEYVAADGSVRGDTQCCYVLAIAYGLVEGELRLKLGERLVADIESRGWRLSTGFIGTKDLMVALSDIGRNDVALRLLHQQTYPGWLFSINHGATSIWERWDGWTPERGFQSADMNSFSHYSFGAVYGWMVEHLGGIQPKQPGCAEVLIQPSFDSQLDSCHVTYDGIRGLIHATWSREAGRVDLTVAIPPNVTGEVLLPDAEIKDVQIDGKTLDDSQLTAEHRLFPDGRSAVVVRIPSGEYRFAAFRQPENAK
ncbi:MAG: family 78 glycoside hydrolase catalytic domain [Pirellulales bacterium]|nr:family 78 glycoside hydrolase catalytic domain [Pirellulales bacterium]